MRMDVVLAILIPVLLVTIGLSAYIWFKVSRRKRHRPQKPISVQELIDSLERIKFTNIENTKITITPDKTPIEDNAPKDDVTVTYGVKPIGPPNITSLPLDIHKTLISPRYK